MQVQYFDRSSVAIPEYFRTSAAVSWRSRLLDYFAASPEHWAQAFLEPSDEILWDPTVRKALARLFRGKCAFCERRVDTGVYRFRPVSEALPVGRTKLPHLYYTWLAEAWENLLPICEDCLPGRPDLFPVSGSRAALPSRQAIAAYIEDDTGRWHSYPPREVYRFLDPCHDIHFPSNLGVSMSGHLIGRTEKGRSTISHFGLNRGSLVNERAGHIERTYHRIFEALAFEKGRSDHEFAEIPFGGCCYLFLRQLGRALGARSNQITRTEVSRFLKALADRPQGYKRVQAALERVEASLERGSERKAEMSGPRRGFSRLKTVKITNLKALEKIEITLPQAAGGEQSASGSAPALLIIGENAAGKSTMLEAVALALSDHDVIESLRLSPSDFVLDPEMMGAQRDEKRSASVELAFHGEPRCELQISSRSFDHSWSRRSEAPPVFAYGAFRHFQSASTRFTVHRHVRSLFQSDYVLPNPEKWLLTLSNARFEMVVRSLRSIFAIGEDFDVMTRDNERGRCYVRQRFARPDGTTAETLLPLKVVSSGFRTILAMACDLMQGLMDERVYGGFETLRTASAIVLIDEIEAHLHPRWKMQIMRGLREALPNVTFIASTHDPLCIRGMNDGEVVVMRRTAVDDADQTDLPVLVQLDDQLPPVSTLTVEQLLTSDIFQLHSTDSAEIEREFAKVADLVARQAAGQTDFSDAEDAMLRKFSDDIETALPVGAGEVQRIAQEALAEHLKHRRAVAGERLADLNRETKDAIVQALAKL